MGRDFHAAFLAELRAAVDIVDVVSDTVSLKKKGASWWGLCPFHGENTASFKVDREKGLYHCFGCDAGGDALGFLMEMEKMTFPEACEQLAARFHVTLPEATGPSQDRGQLEKLRQVVSRTQQIFRQELRQSGRHVVDYLRGRGLDDETIDAFAFGWAPDRWDRVTGSLARDFGEPALVEAGVAIRHPERGTIYDRFRGRVTLPIHDGQGRAIGFGGRILGDGEPKYLNSPESPLFNKSTTLFNLHRARRETRHHDRILLVEGYFDTVILVAGGFPEVVATLGTALTERHADALRRSAARVLLCYDGDDAGRKAAVRSLAILWGRGIEARVVPLPDGADPDSILRQEGAEAFSRRLDGAVEGLDFLLGRERDLGSAEGRRGAAARLVEVLAAHPDPVWRYASAERAAERLGLPVELLWEKLGGRPRAVPAARSSPRNDAETARGADSGSRRILQLMLADTTNRRHAAEVLEEEDFDLPSHREIFRILLDEVDREGALDFRELIAHLNMSPAASELSALALEEGPPDQPGELEKHLHLLKRRSLRRRGTSLQEEIHRLQTTGDDPERLDALLKAKTEISRRLQRLTRNGEA